MDLEQPTQQIQALIANVEELTHQNEESRRVGESQNGERQWTSENQNEEEQPRRSEGNNNEESDSQINRTTRVSEEYSSRMESELRNIRRDMDELKSAVKDKTMENLDGMFRRTNLPFTIEVLNPPLLLKFLLP